MVPAFRPRCQDGSASRDSGEADGFLRQEWVFGEIRLLMHDQTAETVFIELVKESHYTLFTCKEANF